MLGLEELGGERHAVEGLVPIGDEPLEVAVDALGDEAVASERRQCGIGRLDEDDLQGFAEEVGSVVEVLVERGRETPAASARSAIEVRLKPWLANTGIAARRI